MKLMVIFILMFVNAILGTDMNNKYTYNDNGRIITPSSDEIENLPQDGGELWNRLIFEKSPYLLQHAANPVNWYPWSDEAFEIARKLNKPVFLSIGYSTCHWCHVMEHQSFEDTEVANLMNNAFVNIKVDREERPDIDNVYMEVTQKMTGRGGWPMTVIMTPDKQPFFAGTYFPKNSRPNYNRVGMMELIPTISELWITKKDSLLKTASDIVNQLSINKLTQHNVSLKKTILTDSFKSFQRRFDSVYGGFTGSRNKFPKPHDFSFLARYYYKTKDQSSLDIIEKSLYEMKQGGIYDQVGFGFHRYSTDKKWLVPHFEKMLYDQAMIIHAYLDAYQLTSDDFYAQTAKEVCEYVLRDMTDDNGGFYSAEDADSEGEEGLYYIWKSDELKTILNDDEYSFISYVLNIKENGNSVVEGHRANIPHFTKTWIELEKKYSKPHKELFEYYNDIRNKMYLLRENRIHPQKDDKILTDWNGLMISALARAYVILDEEKYLEAAKKSADFILENLMDSDGGLLKRYRDGESGIKAMIEDYAFFTWGLIELYQADFNVKYIAKAAELSDYQIDHFWDFDNGGFYFTSDKTEELIIRNKEIYDGAIPSGNSVSAYNFIRLGRILSRYDYEVIALDLVNAFAPQLNRYGSGSTMLLHALDFIEGPSYEVIIKGKYNKSKGLIREIQQHQQPNKVIIVDRGNSDVFDYLDNYPESSETIVYVCQNYSCQLPTSDINKIKSLLE